MYPFYWLITTSFKTYIDAFSMPPKFLFTPTFENYRTIFSKSNFGGIILNSVISSVTSTAFGIMFGVPCAYALAKLSFKHSRGTSFFFLSARFAPPIIILLPMYIIFNHLHLSGTRLPLIIMYFSVTLPIVIWMMPVYFRDIPDELCDAAVIDGCTEQQVFFKIMMPLAKSSIATTAIYCVIITWNEFLIALILSNKATQTLPVAITSFLTFQGTEWGPLSAAGSIVMIPMILFGFAIQKYFVKGLVSGAVKG
jgi:ABC-type glycerol-3-phosphate transport system permease component